MSLRPILFVQLLALLFSVSITSGGLIGGGGEATVSGVMGNLLLYGVKALAVGMPIGIWVVRFTLEPRFRVNSLLVLTVFRHLALIGGLALIGATWAVAPAYSFVKGAIFVLVLAATLCLFCQYRGLCREFGDRVFERHVLWSCALLGLAFLVAFAANAGEGMTGGAGGVRFQAAGTLVAPTTAAALAGLSVLLAAHVRSRSRGVYGGSRLQVLTTLLALGSVVILLVLDSRGATIALLSAVLLGVGLKVQRKMTALRAVSVLVAVVALYLLVEFRSVWVGHFLRPGQEGEFWALSGRTWLWGRTLEQLSLVRGLVGYGFSAISDEVGIRDWWTGGKSLAGAHNAYLQVFLGLGVGGLLLFLRYLYEFSRSLGRRLDHEVDVDDLYTRFYIIYFVVCCLTDHLVGLNVSPTLFVLLCIHEINSQRESRRCIGVLL